MPIPTRAAIRDFVIERLIDHRGGDVAALRKANEVDLMIDVAVDSLHMAEIVLEIELKFSVRIPHHEMTPARMRSVNRFSDYILSKIAQKAAS
jgi:acyl carrier protein